MTTTCGCCTGTIGACAEGCCCAACTPAPGGRTRDVREEIARALLGAECGYIDEEWMAPHLRRERIRQRATDAILALPAIAAAERVRAWADDMDTVLRDQSPCGDRLIAHTLTQLAMDVANIRRALDGEP